MESKEIRKRAYSHFESGLHCSEVISKTILELFSEKPHPEVIKAASGFGGGIAGSTEELCGAFTGGVLTLGLLLGRENGGESLKDCSALIKEFKNQFLEEFGSLNCQTLLNGFREGQNPPGCVKLTADATAILAGLLNGFEMKGETGLKAFCTQPRGRVELGRCPFSA